MRTGLCLVIAAALLFSACGDKTVNNYYYGSETATVTGSVYPSDEAIAVIIEEEGINVAVEEGGTFTIRNVPPGTYDIVIQPTTYSRRIVFDVLLTAGEVRNLGKLELSMLPYPIYRAHPTEEELNDPRRVTTVRLYTDEPLNIDDLNTLVTIDPPLAGSWRELAPAARTPAQYHFEPESSDLPYGQIYDFTIPASVKTARGEMIGEDVSLQFRTQALQVDASVAFNGLDRTVSINNFQVQISFVTDVVLDSLNKAVTFVPDIPGQWLTQDLPRSRYFGFFKTSSEPLIADTEYMMVIADDVVLTGSASLPLPDTTFFLTEPIGVTNVTPRDGSIGVRSTAVIGLAFNALMDRTSAEAAFSLSEQTGESVAGVFTWQDPSPGDMMLFQPDAPLSTGTVYRIALSTDALTAEGAHLSRDFESFFGVR